ncbi:helix-turn-helix transcriptional regulator [Bradyrhizobium sp. U87765 SZCCT0131]|uniref:helix-turn-helix domain-containing protein n=1 Tax=unclassified Bradyrhizobium TaxID=2631580 RepID=UPI001BA7054E|nr:MULTISPECIES: helix-turn-helix transcriptional regulator [unclassified Bradyrhizobium]MBR1218553.1 helix-turn-helix transcriptional regulator [Bradyrhizobium sp. U87765 SZCCT0131]MBR1260501.1 helix-turn-helix transcriptional regulator [Bradyrhizobium sp. U87765 SZCCT0134]MBR1304051.1 helix-turn-helix transcriptional regulator [Bradyrhizobium sp. U87765 SZCCT0110]MBR1319657.1 helix-turn-helix transcriptional regulator [Bradyrhizobium sp. U87765 SZCCT0109]MBR1347982.1 helix-turn-helix transcr
MTRKTGAYDVEIGQRIRAQRLSRGMSQEDLAERLGITFQQVQKYEKGGNRVTAARLREIANALKLPIVSFYGHDSYAADNGARKNGETSDLHVQEFITSTRAINLLKHFSRIKDPSVQNMVVFLCEQLAERHSDD